MAARGQAALRLGATGSAGKAAAVLACALDLAEHGGLQGAHRDQAMPCSSEGDSG